MRISAAVLSAAVAISSGTPDWTAVDTVLNDAVAAQVFPGCAAGVIDATGALVYAKAFGSFVYPGQVTPVGHNNPAVTTSTLFDMASVSKILGATTASAVLYQRGLLDLDMYVDDPSLLGPAYSVNGKDKIRIADCLLHQAGYPPDPSPGYSDAAFGCPATALPHPPLTFNCSERIFQSLLAQTLQYPTGTQFIYSDLSMITMQFVLGTVIAANGLVSQSDLRPDCASADPTAQPGLYKTCHFEAFVRTKLHQPIGMASSQYIIPSSLYASAMPTWNESGYYRNTVIQGTVSDDNAYALGGIAGHAGVFSNLNDMLRFTAMWAGYGYNDAHTDAPAAAADDGRMVDDGHVVDGNEMTREDAESNASGADGTDDKEEEEEEEVAQQPEEMRHPRRHRMHRGPGSGLAPPAGQGRREKPGYRRWHGDRRHGHKHGHHGHGHRLTQRRRSHMHAHQAADEAGEHASAPVHEHVHTHNGHAHSHPHSHHHHHHHHHHHSRALHEQPEQAWPTLVNRTTRNTFFAAPRPAFSPRGLGWVVQTPTDTYLGCGNFSGLTAYHTGYTGTLLCIDPSTNVSTVLLTNRVYPNSTGEAAEIHATRQAFNNAVLRVLNITPSPAPGPVTQAAQATSQNTVSEAAAASESEVEKAQQQGTVATAITASARVPAGMKQTA